MIRKKKENYQESNHTELAFHPEGGVCTLDGARRGAEFSLGPRAGYLWWLKNHPSSPWEVGGKRKNHPSSPWEVGGKGADASEEGAGAGAEPVAGIGSSSNRNRARS